MRETTLQTPRSVKKEGEEVLQVPEQIPLQPVVQTMVMQVVSLRPMEDHGGVAIHTAAHGGHAPHDGAGGHVLKEAAAHGGPVLELAPGRNCGPWRGVHTGAVFPAGAVAQG